MKFNFKKVASVMASLAMVGSTMGFAVAANYPAPFTSGSVNDVAIVVGSGTGANDMAAALSIGQNLASNFPSTVGLPTDGDFVLVELGQTKFNIGKGLRDVMSTGSLTDDNLGTVLADGRYLDDDNKGFDYTQKVVLANLSLSLFDDSDYKQDTPTVGIRVPSSGHILNYTLEFSSNPEWEDMANTELEIMGKKYFISSVTTNTTINLLDAANTAIVKEGETISINAGEKTYSVTLNSEYLSGSASSPRVKLVVNGAPTNSLAEGNTYQLADGTYIGIKDISMRDVAGAVASVEFSIGNGKIELRNALPVRINEATVNGLTAYFTNTASTSPQQLNKIVLEWNADSDEFATEDSDIVMPGLENIKLSFAGMEYPAEETIQVEKGSNTYMRLKSFPLKDGVTDIDLLYGNGTDFLGTGKEATKQLLTTTGVASSVITFDADNHQYFVASYDDGINSESYLVRAGSFGVKADGVTNTTDIQYWSNGAFVSKKSEAVNGDVISLGSASLTLGAINRNDKTVAITAGSNVYFDRVFSAEGLKVYLPIANTTVLNHTLSPAVWPQFNANTTSFAYAGVSTYPLGFLEETKTGATTGGKQFNATLGWTSSKATVSGLVGESPDGGLEIGDTDVFRSFIYGDLGTELLLDTAGDQDSLKIIYHGGESYGKVYVSESGASSSSGGANIVPITDTEAANLNVNMIVVGGSCINSVAASLLGVSPQTCGAAWTSATNVGAGQYLIQSFNRSGKIATLVAGYEAADTTNAANALRTQTIETTAGVKYTGSTASNPVKQ